MHYCHTENTGHSISISSKSQRHIKKTNIRKREWNKNIRVPVHVNECGRRLVFQACKATLSNYTIKNILTTNMTLMPNTINTHGNGTGAKVTLLWYSVEFHFHILPRKTGFSTLDVNANFLSNSADQIKLNFGYMCLDFKL